MPPVFEERSLSQRGLELSLLHAELSLTSPQRGLWSHKAGGWGIEWHAAAAWTSERWIWGSQRGRVRKSKINSAIENSKSPGNHTLPPAGADDSLRLLTSSQPIADAVALPAADGANRS